LLEDPYHVKGARLPRDPSEEIGGSSVPNCLLCRRDEADRVFDRAEVWRDDLWRLAMARSGPVAGFAHLEPLRHIPHVTDLDGPEAATFGPVLARVTRTLQRATAADLVYANIFGERVAHLHVNLAPHVEGDGLLGGPGMLRPDTPDVPADRLKAIADVVRAALTDEGDAGPPS
jgi:diadenosine tetraphosphate (Ap4A) HIT family hydrolase